MKLLTSAVLMVAIAARLSFADISCYVCPGENAECAGPSDNGELTDCPGSLSCVAMDFISGGEQRIARSCLPMIESQEESYEGCMDIKTSGMEGIVCNCRTNGCNAGDPKELDDCVKN